MIDRHLPKLTAPKGEKKGWLLVTICGICYAGGLVALKFGTPHLTDWTLQHLPVWLDGVKELPVLRNSPQK